MVSLSLSLLYLEKLGYEPSDLLLKTTPLAKTIDSAYVFLYIGTRLPTPSVIPVAARSVRLLLTGMHNHHSRC